MEDLTKKETELLRDLYWQYQESKGNLDKALKDVAEAHGKKRGFVTPDYKRIFEDGESEARPPAPENKPGMPGKK